MIKLRKKSCESLHVCNSSAHILLGRCTLDTRAEPWEWCREKANSTTNCTHAAAHLSACLAAGDPNFEQHERFKARYNHPFKLSNNEVPEPSYTILCDSQPSAMIRDGSRPAHLPYQCTASFVWAVGQVHAPVHPLVQSDLRVMGPSLFSPRTYTLTPQSSRGDKIAVYRRHLRTDNCDTYPANKLLHEYAHSNDAD